jgi:hypothetical protein
LHVLFQFFVLHAAQPDAALVRVIDRMPRVSTEAHPAKYWSPGRFD